MISSKMLRSKYCLALHLINETTDIKCIVSVALLKYLMVSMNIKEEDFFSFYKTFETLTWQFL